MNRVAKTAIVVAVAVIAVVALFTVVFPWIDRLLADPTLGVTVRLG